MLNFKSQDFQEKLSTLTLPNDEFYKQISPKYFQNNGGVYVLRSYESDEITPISIPRCLGNDSFGILYIGKASKFTHRTGDLARAFEKKYKQEKHDCAVRYNSNTAWNDIYPKKYLKISFFISDSPKDLESKFLESYISKYGEVPPLNSQS